MMSTVTSYIAFHKFDNALQHLNWHPFSLSYRSGYDPAERIYQVGNLEFRVKETQQGYTDSYGLTTYLANQENPEDPETLRRLRERIIHRLDEAYKIHILTKDSQRRTQLLQQVWENQIKPLVQDELEFFQVTNYDLNVKDNSFRLNLGEEHRRDGYKVDDYIILRGFFNPLEVSIYALYLNKLFQFFGMLQEPEDKDWDGTMHRVQAYIQRFYDLAKTIRGLLEEKLRDEQFEPPKEIPKFSSMLSDINR